MNRLSSDSWVWRHPNYKDLKVPRKLVGAGGNERAATRCLRNLVGSYFTDVEGKRRKFGTPVLMVPGLKGTLYLVTQNLEWGEGYDSLKKGDKTMSLCQNRSNDNRLAYFKVRLGTAGRRS